MSQTRLNGSMSSLTCEEGKSFLLMNINISVKGTDCLPCSALDFGGRCLLMSYCPATAVSPNLPLHDCIQGDHRHAVVPFRLALVSRVWASMLSSLSSLECTGLVSTVLSLCEEERDSCPSFSKDLPLRRVMAEVQREGCVSKGCQV